MIVSGEFQVQLQPIEPYAAGSDGVTLGRSIEKVFTGALEANSKGEMLSAFTTTKGSAGYVAIEQVVGSLSGQKGSFVLQHHYGTMNRGTDYLLLEVVPDSGAGELSGIAGKMLIKIENGKHCYEFEYTFADV